MVSHDSEGTKVKTRYKGVFPKGTTVEIKSCRFIERTTTRIYLVQTHIGEVAWYIDRDLVDLES